MSTHSSSSPATIRRRCAWPPAKRPPLPQVPCWITYTNERRHAIIRDGLPRSPLFRGDVAGTGPRYCPSIEDKVVRFADKDRHQIFLEPENVNTGQDARARFPNGISTSLPFDLRLAFLGRYRARARQMTRPGYAGEYDSSIRAKCSARSDPPGRRPLSPPGRSTAPRATRRRRSRVCSPGSTRRSRSASGLAIESR